MKEGGTAWEEEKWMPEEWKTVRKGKAEGERNAVEVVNVCEKNIRQSVNKGEGSRD